MLKKNFFSYVKMCGRLCSLDTSKSLCSYFSPKLEYSQAVEVEERGTSKKMSPPPKKDWFLYMMVDSALCRLSISQFCQKSSPKPLFELVHDFSPEEPPAHYPFDMDVHIVNSKLYSLGGGRHIDDSFEPNLDVYCLDLTSSEGPSICEDPGICEGLRTCEGLRICEDP